MTTQNTEQREILGVSRTVRELLKGQKYSIDYYQRDYKWQTKQVEELIDDLTDRFLEAMRTTIRGNTWRLTGIISWVPS